MVVCGWGCDRKDLPITVVTGEWKPYVFSVPGGAEGRAADVVTAAFREMNYEPVYEFRQWAVVEKLIKEDRIEVAFPFVKHRNRDTDFCYSKALGEGQIVLYYNSEVHRDPLSASQIEQKKREYKLVTVEGYQYPDAITNMFGGDPVVLDSEKDAFRRLIKGDSSQKKRIDFLPAMEKVGDSILSEDFPEHKHNVKKITNAHWAIEYYLVVPKRDKNGCAGNNLLQDFNQGLDNLRDNKGGGVYAKLIAPYDTPTKVRGHMVLRATDKYPLIVGTMTQDGDLRDPRTDKVLIPDHTPAIVVEWGTPFEQIGKFDLDLADPWHYRSRVRLLDGPAKDIVVWVPSLFLSFETRQQAK